MGCCPSPSSIKNKDSISVSKFNAGSSNNFNHISNNSTHTKNSNIHKKKTSTSRDNKKEIFSPQRQEDYKIISLNNECGKNLKTLESNYSHLQNYTYSNALSSNNKNTDCMQKINSLIKELNSEKNSSGEDADAKIIIIKPQDDIIEHEEEFANNKNDNNNNKIQNHSHNLYSNNYLDNITNHNTNENINEVNYDDKDSNNIDNDNNNNDDNNNYINIDENCNYSIDILNTESNNEFTIKFPNNTTGVFKQPKKSLFQNKNLRKCTLQTQNSRLIESFYSSKSQKKRVKTALKQLKELSMEGLPIKNSCITPSNDRFNKIKIESGNVAGYRSGRSSKKTIKYIKNLYKSFKIKASLKETITLIYFEKLSTEYPSNDDLIIYIHNIKGNWGLKKKESSNINNNNNLHKKSSKKLTQKSSKILNSQNYIYSTTSSQNAKFTYQNSASNIKNFSAESAKVLNNYYNSKPELDISYDFLGSSTEKLNDNNLCCLLYRIGYDRNYQPVKIEYEINGDEMSKKITIRNPDKLYGPIFFKMNINKEYLDNNNMTIDGSLEIEIDDMFTQNYFYIFKRIGFMVDPQIETLYTNNIYLLSTLENEIILFLNLFRFNIEKFIHLFFGEKMYKNYYNLNCYQIINPEIELKEISNKKFYDNLNYFNQYSGGNNVRVLECADLNQSYDGIIMIIVKLFNPSAIDIIEELIKYNYSDVNGKRNFIANPKFTEIGIKIKCINNEYICNVIFGMN